MTRYTVLKKTGTHADVLAAAGAADLLRELDPRILDLQDRFVVELRRPLIPADLDRANAGYERLDREAAKDRVSTIVTRMKAHGGPNALVEKFSKMRPEEWSRRVWESLHGRPDFVFSAPLVQLFNPQCCRGYALMKPAGTHRSDKTKDRWAEPFLEWLRFRGYFAVSAGWFSSGDLRLFSPIPASIRGHRLAAVGARFRDLKLSGSSVKIDCRAVLGLARILIETANTHEPANASLSGVYVTHYKDMGQAHTLIAMDRLALPNWFELRTREQAARWLETIEGHDTVIRRLDDTHSDEFALLKQYRFSLQWQARNAIGAFVEFLADYTLLVFKRRSLEEWLLPQFSSAGTAPILRGDPEVRGLLRQPGFLAVAAALRGATIGAQAARHYGRDDHREIRYGLLSDLRRAPRRDTGRIISTFIDAFNAESLRRHRAGLRAARIAGQELEGCLSAMERLPARLSPAGLLCAMAGCRPADAAAARSQERNAEAIPA